MPFSLLSSFFSLLLSPLSVRSLSALAPLSLRSLSALAPLSLRSRSALSPLSLRSRSALSPFSLRSLSVLSPLSLRSLSALAPLSLRSLSALSPFSLRSLSSLSFSPLSSTLASPSLVVDYYLYESFIFLFFSFNGQDDQSPLLYLLAAADVAADSYAYKKPPNASLCVVCIGKYIGR